MISARPPAALGRWSTALPTVIDTILKALAPAGAAAGSGRTQGRHGRLLVLRLPTGRLALFADEHFRRRLGRAAEPGRRLGPAFRCPRATCATRRSSSRKSNVQRCWTAMRSGGDSGGAAGLPRRPRSRSHLSDAAAVQGQHQLRAHARSALGPARRASRPRPTPRSCGNRAADGSEAVVLKATEIALAAGDQVTFLTAGGGGYGDPASTRGR